MNRQGTLENGPLSRADMLDRSREYLLLALVASMPFEFRFAVFGLSNLQWLFVLAAIVTAPQLIRKRRELVREPVVIAVVSLALVHWDIRPTERGIHDQRGKSGRTCHSGSRFSLHGAG